MKPWIERSKEIAYLLNPAFCCTILTSSILDYISINPEGMDYPLAFMILPIILHSQSRNSLPRSISTPLAEWIQKNDPITTHFYDRTISLKPFTQETILYGFLHDWLVLEKSGKLKSKVSKNKINRFFQDNMESKEYIDKARLLGRWFASTGSAETVMALWRIKP